MSPEPGEGGGLFAWLRRAYSGAAVLLLNTLVLFVALNALTALALALADGLSGSGPGSLAYPMSELKRAYPGWEEGEIRSLLTETWSGSIAYEPFVQHREEPREGRYLNVHPAGFRHVRGQGPWPPDASAMNVFVFGGSTTFGYGVADWETVPSYLQEELGTVCGAAAHVYNFGGANLYSEQERVLLEGQLARGLRPDVAVFLDGTNEWKDAPEWTGRLARLMGESDSQLLKRVIKTLPLGELAVRVRSWREERAEAAGAGARTLDYERIVDRWVRNRRLIEAAAAEFGVQAFFFWQPVPSYGWDLGLHRLHEDDPETLRTFATLRAGYTAFAERRQADPSTFAGGPVWLADMQTGREEPLYVDVVHYTAAFSRDIARRMAATLEVQVACETDA